MLVTWLTAHLYSSWWRFEHYNSCVRLNRQILFMWLTYRRAKHKHTQHISVIKSRKNAGWITAADWGITGVVLMWHIVGVARKDRSWRHRHSPGAVLDLRLALLPPRLVGLCTGLGSAGSVKGNSPRERACDATTERLFDSTPPTKVGFYCGLLF